MSPRTSTRERTRSIVVTLAQHLSQLETAIEKFWPIESSVRHLIELTKTAEHFENIFGISGILYCCLLNGLRIKKCMSSGIL